MNGYLKILDLICKELKKLQKQAKNAHEEFLNAVNKINFEKILEE